MEPDRALTLLTSHRLLPVIVIDDAQAASWLGSTLDDNGLPIAEVTLRTSAALDAIERLAEQPGLLVAAGTVVRREQVDQAAQAGASVIVSPGFDAEVVRRCLNRGVLPIPGVATATEVQAALGMGAKLLKFFPAGPLGGPTMLRALAAPFPRARFVPTGGIGAGDLPTYLQLPCVAAVGGSFMVPSAALRAGDQLKIGQRIRAAVAAVAAVAAEPS